MKKSDLNRERRTLIIAAIAMLALLVATVPTALAVQQGAGYGYQWIANASYVSHDYRWDSTPFEIKINGNPAAGQIFAVGDEIVITADLRAWALACTDDTVPASPVQAHTNAALEVSGPSGAGSDTAGGFQEVARGCAEVDTVEVLTVNYTLTSPGLHTVDAHSSARADIDVVPVHETDTAEDSLAFEVVANDPPIADAGGPYSGDEGRDVIIFGGASDPESDPLTYLWSYSPVSGVDSGAGCSFADPGMRLTTVTCTDDGIYSLMLAVSDGFHSSVTDVTDLTVANLAPVVSMTGPAEGSLYKVNDSVSLTVSFSDAGVNDTHACSIAWGDTSVTTGVVSESAGAGTCTGDHAYSSAGVYIVQAAVVDDDAGSGSAQVMIVVYDPTAGFVTGGGWIWSPAGAYVGTTLEGKATFGFVSRYQKGVTVPTGNTEFQFKAGNLNFHSSSYEWLVVAGARAQYKGVGSINGASEYRFMLTAIDDQVAGGGATDKFRIKIWDADSVIYDNQIGNPDTADLTTVLGGGNIVIHK